MLREDGQLSSSILMEETNHGLPCDESVSSSVSRENNVCNGALHVIGLYEPGDKVSLSLFLKDWEAFEGGVNMSHFLDSLCQDMHEAR